MKKALALSCFIAVLFCSCNRNGGTVRERTPRPKPAKNTSGKIPDTVKVGIYITSLHDIDFKAKEYNTNFWLWFKYKRKEFDFVNNLEIPMAKTFTKSYSNTDTSNGEVYILMKIQATMKDSWKIGNFPFDRQRLMMSFENSQFDLNEMVFVPDTAGKHFDPRFTLNGWQIDSCVMSVNARGYESVFGLDSLIKPPKAPHMDYSSFRVRLGMTRDASGLFWKMFLGMYIAFLIAFICFFIHADGIDSRFGLSVGALFAVIGNKYIIDSSLPESTSFTLVDTLHGLTLFFIFAVIAATAYSLKLVTKGKEKLAARFDIVTAMIMLFVYMVLNAYFIYQASQSG